MSTLKRVVTVALVVLTGIFGGVVLTACTRGDALVLSRSEWVCTKTEVVSLKPYYTECVTYQRLR